MRKYKKHISIFLLIVFLNEIVFTNVAYALGGGPSQPEVQSFEPVGTTQMVDLFSGDFNYNIPLMDIDGYPINIAYHSGITMDQEASWVGLGWNLNPGVINRNMRGIPDDFDGDEIKKTTYMKPDETYGGQLGVSYELFGFKGKGKYKKLGASVNLSANLGVNYNNYKGLGTDISLGLQGSAGYKLAPNLIKKLGLGLAATAGFQLGSSSQGGGTLTGSYGLDFRLFQGDDMFKNNVGKIGVNSSTSFNSNSATKTLTKISANYNIGYNIKNCKHLKSKGKKEDREGSFNMGAGVSYNSFANHSYTPQIQHNMSNLSLSFSFQYGTELSSGHDISGSLKGYYVGQLMEKRGNEVKSKSYGYHYAENGVGQNDVLLDFNREKDGAFSVHNPTLPIPQTTQDLYSFSGQGVGGMFKSYRSDLGSVYDTKHNSEGKSDSYGLGISIGGIVKVAADVYLNWTESESKRWDNSLNGTFNYVKQSDVPNNPLYETSYLKVIGEKTAIDNDYLPYADISNPSAFQLEKNGDNVDLRKYVIPTKYALGKTFDLPLKNLNRSKRDKRNVFVKQIKASDAVFCLENSIKNADNASIARNSSYRKPHHFSEVSVQNPDGNRYVYGTPAYATNQQDYSFTNAPNPGGGASPTANCAKGVVDYDVNNLGSPERMFGGIDKYYDKTEIPAYAHSYLLTAVLSSDYVDNGMDGPSNDDLGSYTRIDYKKYHNTYKWRVPFEENKANYNRGLYNDDYDDNASIVYGEKEIWHVNSIEGRNHIAKFYLSARKDGYGVKGIHGGIDNQQFSYKLDSIKLFSKSNLYGAPIKSVYFEYNYKLCSGIDNNIDKSTALAQTGKLTLEKIYFTYGNSLKGKYNVYNFKYNYNNTNYSYNLKGYDRWGNFKHNENATCNDISKPLTSEFPYVEQQKDSADNYSQAWNLTEIGLPTGGKITVDYESDDYAYVQERKAMQMYQVLGLGETINSTPSNQLYHSLIPLDKAYKPNEFIFVKLPNQNITNDYFKKMSLANQEDLYYNFMVNLDNKNFDFDNLKFSINATQAYEPIRGYTKSIDAGIVSQNGVNIGWIKIEKVKVSDEVTDETNPISKAAWQFTRINMPYLINPGANLMKKGNGIGAGALSVIKTIVGFIPDVINSFKDANKKLRNAEYASQINTNKSWIRLNNLSGFKYGGGCRVKKLELSDEWNTMEPTGTASSKKYGQVYEYTKVEQENGVDKIISSGVASYEPLIGNDENPYKKPIYYSEEQKGIPDEEYYSEEPFGESYFPSAMVGYSRVTVKSILPDVGNNVAANKTGKVVHEFYTAQDFPTKTSRTDIQVEQIRPEWIWDIFMSKVDDRLTASQGYMVELNDMHGKPKAVWNYSADRINEYKSSEAFSGVSYEYYADPASKTLNNKVPVIYPNNTTAEALVGVDAELFSDTRESTFKSKSGGIQLNLDLVSIGIFPIPVPTGLPDLSNESIEFRSAVLMKVINKYGILKSTTAFENGAQLHTENVLFDSETGEVLLTKTQNEFNDYTYNSTYPAHWAYENMGPAYKNTGATFTIFSVDTSYENFKLNVNGSTLDPSVYLVSGDEVYVEASTNAKHYWVYKTPSNKYVLLDRNGILYNFTNTNNLTIRIITSGRKNMQTMPIAQVVSIENPVVNGHLVHNANSKILQTSVNEYKDIWPKLGCYTDYNVRIPAYDESIETMKHLLLTQQLKMSDYSNDSTTYAYSDAFSNPGTSFSNSIYRKYQDSSEITQQYFAYGVSAKSSEIEAKKSLMIAFTLTKIGNFYNKLVGYDKLQLSFGCNLSYFGDSNDVNTILTKSIAYLSFSGSYNPSIVNYGVLKFTDSTSIDVNISTTSTVYLSDYKLFNSETLNPYRSNLINNWKPFRNQVYLENRLTENNSVKTNIRKDGSYKNYTHFWNYSGNKWQANPTSNWQYTKEVTKYYVTGTEAESKNPLEQYSSVLYSGQTHLPIAVGQNIKYRNIIAENFEEGFVQEHSLFCGQFKATNYGFACDTVSHSGVGSNCGNLSFRVKFLENDQVLNNGTNQYTIDTTNFYGKFSPDPGKYIVSAWVKVGNDPKVADYSNAYIKLLMTTNTGRSEIKLRPKGKIIEGWQRISSEITIPQGIVRMGIDFVNAENAPTGTRTFFDDFRIYPIDGLMKSYVYDKNNRLMAELDENNYATFYEYDEEGNLVRIKKETERGIVTIKEVRSSFKKNN